MSGPMEMACALHPRALVLRRHARGFTLVELMIVVVIVGILSALAVVGYRRLVTSSHVSEATNMVQGIRVAQEAYHSETQQYANISQSLMSWYPQTAPVASQQTAWGGACGAACQGGMDWSMLPLHVDGPVIFGYATIAGPAGTGPIPASVTVNGAVITFPAVPTTDWFVIAASCDLDGQGLPNTTVYAMPWTNQVLVDSEGY